MFETILEHIGCRPPLDGSTNGSLRSGREEAIWRDVFAKLSALKDYEDDWDGQGGQAPDESNIDAVASWLQNMRAAIHPPQQVLPGVGGEVYLNWQRGGSNVIAEIAVPTTLEWIVQVPGQELLQWDMDLPARSRVEA